MSGHPAIPLACRDPKIGDVVLVKVSLPKSERKKVGNYYPLSPCIGKVIYRYQTRMMVQWYEGEPDNSVFTMRMPNHGNAHVDIASVKWNYGPLIFQRQHPLRDMLPGVPPTQQVAPPNGGYLPLAIAQHVYSCTFDTPLNYTVLMV